MIHAFIFSSLTVLFAYLAREISNVYWVADP